MQKKEILFLAILIVVVFGLYGKSLDFGLIWDSKNFLENDFSQFEGQNLSSVLEQGYFKEPYTDKSHYFRPLTFATFFLEDTLWGIKNSYLRSVNILIYVFSLVFLFIFFKRQSSSPYFPEIATALFALYPLNMENIVWVVGRGDLFLLLWGTLTFLSSELWISQKKHAYWILGCLIFAIGLLSKEAFIFLIPTLILFELVKRKKIFVPYYMIMVMFSIVFFIFKGRVIGIKNLDLYLSSGWIHNAKALLASLGYYFKSIIFPLNYDRFYPYKDLINLKFIVLGMMAILTFSYIAFRGRKDKSILIPLSLIAVFTSAHMLLIFTSVFQFKVYARYMMLPGLGLVWIFSYYLAKLDIKIKMPVAGLLCIFFILSISLNINAYRSSVHFWQSAHTSLPQNGFVLYSLASAYSDDQDYLSTELYLNKALSRALDKPTALSVSLLYANIEFRKAEYKNAIRWLNNAAQNLGYPETNVAIYRNSQINLLKGQVYLSQGKFEDAIQVFKENIQTLEGHDAQRESYLALFSLYLGQEMWNQAKDLEINMRTKHPTALDKHTVEIEKIFKESSPEKKTRFYTHYMNYAQAIHNALSHPATNLEAKFALIELFYFADRGDEAEKVITDLMLEGKEDYRILNSIGHFYLNRLLRAEQALVFFDKSLKERKNQPEIALLINRLRNDFLSQLTEVW